MNYDDYMKEFRENRVKNKDKTVNWIQRWFNKNGPDCNAIIGISGGKDSTVAASLCVEALGKERVKGILMPDCKQDDILDSYNVCKHLDIEWFEVNIHKMVRDFTDAVLDNHKFVSKQTMINLRPRIRMVTLYAFAQSMNGRVVNTCNLSEDYIGWSTRWGDDVGDFAPLRNFTTEEVIEIGFAMNLPHELILKTPADGITNKSDEDNFGFTYKDLNTYIRTHKLNNEETKKKIDEMHERNAFKMRMPATFVL